MYMDVFDPDEGQLSICLSVTDCLNGLNEFLRKFLRSLTKQDLSVSIYYYSKICFIDHANFGLLGDSTT